MLYRHPVTGHIEVVALGMQKLRTMNLDESTEVDGAAELQTIVEQYERVNAISRQVASVLMKTLNNACPLQRFGAVPLGEGLCESIRLLRSAKGLQLRVHKVLVKRSALLLKRHEKEAGTDDDFPTTAIVSF